MAPKLCGLTLIGPRYIRADGRHANFLFTRKQDWLFQSLENIVVETRITHCASKLTGCLFDPSGVDTIYEIIDLKIPDQLKFLNKIVDDFRENVVPYIEAGTTGFRGSFLSRQESCSCQRCLWYSRVLTDLEETREMQRWVLDQQIFPSFLCICRPLSGPLWKKKIKDNIFKGQNQHSTSEIPIVVSLS